MMNFRDCGELFELGELNPDTANATEVYALCVHVSLSSNPDANVCSNLVTRDTVRYVAPLIDPAGRTEALIAR